MKKLLTLAVGGMLLPLANYAQHAPSQDGSLFTIQVGSLAFEVDSAEGAKVSSLTISDDEFLVTSSMVDSYFLWGATLWPSPQSEWNWKPENFNWDHHGYTASVEADTMRFQGPVGTVDKKGDSFYFEKDFWGNPEDSTISLRYALVNASGKPIHKALWELTRVPVGGLTFWPTGPGGCWGQLSGATEEAAGHTWYLRESQDGTNLKFFADGSEGWFAHVDDQNRLYVKTFEDVDQSDFAPGEGEIELWVADEYIELENQGAYQEVADGDRLIYEVKWYLLDLPEGLDVSVGSIELLGFVNALLNGGGGTPIFPESPFTDALRLYPNPAHSLLHVEVDGQLCSLPYVLYDMTGKAQLQGHSQGSIKVSELHPGLYFLQLRTEDRVLKRKVLIR